MKANYKARYLDIETMKQQETTGNCIMGNFIICILALLGWLNQDAVMDVT
jgi:hypothetical protein